MNIKDIKVGETYNVRVKVECIDEDGWFKVRTSEKAISFVLSPKEQEAFSLLPKYDPCRKFRKGDKVQVKKRDGRCNGKAGEYLREAFCTVAEDETQNELVRVLHNATEYRLDPAYLALVTPVEELEISRVFNDKKMGAWVVTKDNFTHAYFPYRCKVSDNIANSKEEAKAAAEAERDRLNAKYRKEQK